MSVLIDPLFVIVFLVAMWIYSSTLFIVTALTLPAYVLVAAALTRPIRARIDEKF